MTRFLITEEALVFSCFSSTMPRLGTESSPAPAAMTTGGLLTTPGPPADRARDHLAPTRAAGERVRTFQAYVQLVRTTAGSRRRKSGANLVW